MYLQTWAQRRLASHADMWREEGGSVPGWFSPGFHLAWCPSSVVESTAIEIFYFTVFSVWLWRVCMSKISWNEFRMRVGSIRTERVWKTEGGKKKWRTREQQGNGEIRNFFKMKTKTSCMVTLTAGISVSPMSIPKISVKVTGCPEAFLVHRAWM